ncbi:hypothetical protein CHLRE_10g423400v5 [Chlamydomonas reinhardtii]|uniref:tRNA-dihydrouridine(47) synthase [NAD(P)(+)] n=1 Tax=Chlamydomonas reinhardtii TaxID=3055 RepID=A0A2K3D9B8_CHLRE|nr:uncharacterized protein CHLRE_10g423400v5 [Chlamydomonas reinhardtii]PNW77131.1 hypothetical protein CHLRE_10g423400v5 [Chlamydomonas reinhardtii]
MLAQMRGRLGAPCAAGRSCQPPPLHSATPRRPLRSFVVPAAASVDEVSNAPPVTTDWSADRRSSGEASTSGQEQGFDYDAPAWVRERNAVFAKQLEGKLVLAPLTKGGNVPFRRLCLHFGAEVTMSEMAFTKPLLKGDRVERARLYKAPGEQMFGFQVACKTISDGIAASKLAKEGGAQFLDINCGCPIYEATRRGMGSAMLRKPRALAKMVAGIAADSELPVTVKIRLGENDKKIVVDTVVDYLHRAGAAAVTVHGRTAEQRYKKAADWAKVGEVARSTPVPIIGNGDILTHYEAHARRTESGCTAVMAGRGALIKPWIFQEYKEGREWLPSTEERVGVYRLLVSYMKEHFGDDERGRRKAWYFFPWHFDFLNRYRPLPEAVYGAASREHPLIMTRMDLTDARVGEEGPEGLGWAERLLRCEHPESHEAIASALWEAASDADAVAALERIGREGVEAWEEAVRAGGRGGDAARGGGLGVGGPAGGEGDGGREGGGRGGRRSRNDDAELERG